MRKSFSFSKGLGCFLCCWIVGLLLGIFFAAETGFAVSMMRRAASCRVSIVLLFVGGALPFLIAAYAVMIERYFILFSLVLLRCFCFGYCAWTAVLSFGSAGWLVQPMLQFTDSILLAVLCFFSLRWSGGYDRHLKRDLTFCIALTAAVAVIDFSAVSPFLASLLEP